MKRFFKLSIACLLFICLFGLGENGLAKGFPKEEIRDLRRASYLELGGTLGHPIYINGTAGYWFGPVGLRVTGMYFGRCLNGIQLNFNYKLSDNDKQIHSLGIVIAKSEDAGCEWAYAGPVYNFNHKGFFLELGWVTHIYVWRGDFSDLPFFPDFQIGYVYRFLPKKKK